MSITVHVEHPDGVGTTVQGPAPFAVPCTTRKCRSSHRLERGVGIGNPCVDLVGGANVWTASPSLANCFYLVGATTQPTNIMMDGLVARHCGATATNIAPGGWWHGDNDSLGYSTIYVHLVGNGDPDTAGLELLAVYGQGGSWAPYGTSGLIARSNLTYNDATGELSGTDAWLLYGYQVGDYFELSYGGFSAGSLQWVPVTSKTDKDTIVVTAGLVGDGLTTPATVTCYVPIHSEYAQLTHEWEFTGNVRQYTNSDTRPDAPSATIPYLTYKGSQCCPIFDGDGTIIYNVSDLFNDDTPETSTITVDAETDTWDGTTYYLSSSGADANAGTEIAPFGSLAKGLTMLIAAGARSRLLVKRGDTGIALTSASVTALPPYSSSTDKLISTYGSGAKPAFAAFTVNTAGAADTAFDLNSSSAKLRIEDLAFPLHGGANPWLTSAGDRHLLSRVEVAKSGGGACISSSSVATLWNVVHDCILSSSATYVMFFGVSEAAPEDSMGLTAIGSSFYGGFAEHTCRIYQANMLATYCRMEHPGVSASAGVVLRCAGAEEYMNLDHTCVQYNNLTRNDTLNGGPCFATTETVGGSPGFRNFVVFRSNFCNHSIVNTRAGTDAIGIEKSRWVWIENNIAYGYANRFVASNDPNNQNLFIANNTVYSLGTHSRFLNHNENGAIRNLLIMNNIIRVRGTGSNDPIQHTRSSGSEDVKPFTHVFNNIFDCSLGSNLRIQNGASPADYRIDSTGSETTWVSVRPGQTNLGGNSSDALDPQLNAPGSNHLPVVGSPVINAGKVIANIVLDHRNYRPAGSGTRNDIGAMELEAVAEEIDGAYLYENSDFILLEDDSGVLLLESGVSTGLIPNYRRRRV